MLRAKTVICFSKNRQALSRGEELHKFMITGFIYRILMSYLTWKDVNACRCLSGVLLVCRTEWKMPVATPSSQYSTEECLYTLVSQPHLEIIWSYGMPDLYALLEIFSCNSTLKGENGSALAFLVSYGSWTQVLALINFADGKYAQLSLTSLPCIMNNNELGAEFWMHCIMI